MQPPIDIATLPAPARRILDPASPAALRQMAAKGIAPGLKPAEALTVVALLAEAEDPAVAAPAKATMDRLPAPLLNGALGGELPAGLLAALAVRYATNAPVMEKLLSQKNLLDETVAEAAGKGSEDVCELIAVNEERLLKHPAIIEKLYMNKATRMSTADRVLELGVRNGLELRAIPAFKEAAAAIVNELVAEASVEPTPDDLAFREIDRLAESIALDPALEDTHTFDEETGQEVVEKKFVPLSEELERETVSQKIRRAMLGNATERMLLVRNSNKLVAQAAIRSPGIQENEVTRISASRNVSEDVLRIIATDKQWSGSHQIKLNLVQNPRCPLVFAAKLVPHLREHELKAIAKSKNVKGEIARSAKQQLERRGK